MLSKPPTPENGSKLEFRILSQAVIPYVLELNLKYDLPPAPFLGSDDGTI